MFWVSLPKYTQILSRPTKGSSLAENTRFDVSIVPIGQEMRPGRVAKQTKKKKEKKRNSEM